MPVPEESNIKVKPNIKLPENPDVTITYENGVFKSCSVSNFCLSRAHGKCGVYRREERNGSINPECVSCIDNQFIGHGYNYMPKESPKNKTVQYVSVEEIIKNRNT